MADTVSPYNKYGALDEGGREFATTVWSTLRKLFTDGAERGYDARVIAYEIMGMANSMAAENIIRNAMQMRKAEQEKLVQKFHAKGGC